MPKVILFSRKFPKGHPNQGEPTYFVEKLWESTGLPDKEYSFNFPDEYLNYIRLEFDVIWPKSHTVRSGHRWKAGDKFSPRVWQDKPYRSKQLIIAPDIEIKKVWDVMIYETMEVYINGKFFCTFGSENADALAKNDGLSHNDFRDWFIKSLPFDGQIICWNESINYGKN